MKILLTGTTGLLGSALTSGLTRAGYRVTPFEGDVSSDQSFEGYHGGRYDWIIHTAAVTDVNECEKNQERCRAVNVEGTERVANLAKVLRARLIYISTVSVFSGEEGDYREGDVPKPLNFYSVSKYLGEQATLRYGGGTVLRINLIGIHPSGSRGKNFMEWLVDTFRSNADIRLFTDVLVNPLSNWTLAEYIRLVIEAAPRESVLHLGSRDRLSKAAVGKLVMRHFPTYSGTVTECSIDTLGGPKRPKEMWLNIERAEQVLGKSMPTLESEVERIIAFEGRAPVL